MIVDVSTMAKHVVCLHRKQWKSNVLCEWPLQDSFAIWTDPALGLLNDLVAVEEQKFRGS